MMKQFLILIAAFIGVLYLNGLFLHSMWIWFVYPAFDTVILTFPQALGIAFLFAGANIAPTLANKTIPEINFEFLFKVCFFPIFNLAVGYFLYRLLM